MTRTSLSFLLAGAALTIAIPGVAHAAGANSTAEALLMRPLTLTKNSDLDFGTLIAGTVPGTATVNAASGARTTVGGAIAAGGTPTRAEFSFVGRPGLLTITTVGVATTLTNGTGGTMASTLALDGPTIRLLPGSGIQTIGVGGTLTVGTNQADGDYTGTFTLTVIYL